MAMTLSWTRLQWSVISRETWTLSMSVSLERLYTLRAVVTPDQRSTAWYTAEMRPVYKGGPRMSKSSTVLVRESEGDDV
jgi:hypothetical protein